MTPNEARWIQNTPGLGQASARLQPTSGADRRTLPPRARDFGQTVEAAEHGQACERDKVDVPLGQAEGTEGCAAHRHPARGQFGQEVGEHVGHRHAAGERQPDAARVAVQEA